MFENLTEKLERSFKILKGEGRITEINVAETLKEIRRALIDADVNYKVAKTFTDEVKNKALGMNVIAYDPFVADDSVFEADGVEKIATVEELYRRADFLSLHIPATPQTKGSIGYDLITSMPKGATLVNTARKEVIDEAGLCKALAEREDIKYVSDVAPDCCADLCNCVGKRYFATPKKMGAETAEANINAGLAAARQIVDFFATGNRRFQVNK